MDFYFGIRIPPGAEAAIPEIEQILIKYGIGDREMSTSKEKVANFVANMQPREIEVPATSNDLPWPYPFTPGIIHSSPQVNEAEAEVKPGTMEAAAATLEFENGYCPDVKKQIARFFKDTSSTNAKLLNSEASAINGTHGNNEEDDDIEILDDFNQRKRPHETSTEPRCKDENQNDGPSSSKQPRM